MTPQVLDSAKKALGTEIQKITDMVNHRLKDVDVLKSQIKGIEAQNETITNTMTSLHEKMDQTEQAFADTTILVDAVRKSADDTQKRLDRFVQEQVEERSTMQGKVGKLEKSASEVDFKVEEMGNTIVEVRDDVTMVKSSLPKLQSSLENLQLDQTRAVQYTKDLEKDFQGLTSRFNAEMANISGTLTAAQEMQVRLTEELSRMQAAAEASENMMDEIRAEQAAGLRKIEQRMDRTDGMLKLKATQSDVIHLLGQKADRGVIDKLAEERMKFLRQVSEQMYAVENKVVDKPDREELSAFAKEEQVQGLIQSTAADLTTFVNSTVHDATHTKADIADCKFLENRIKEVTGEIVELTNEEREKVDARLVALRSQVLSKADDDAVRKMRKTVSALAHAQLEDQTGDSAGLFFRCLTCGTNLPKLQGNDAIEALAGMLPQQRAAPAVAMLEETATTNEEVRKLLEEAEAEAYSGVVSQPVVDLPHASTGRRLLLTGSDGRLYKGAFLATD